MTDLTTLPDTELQTLLGDAYAEVQRRAILASAPAEAEALATAVSTALGRTDGSLWTDRPVTGAHDVWPPAVICQHPEGEYWRAGRPESHPPGTIGAPWTRVYPDGDGWTETPPAEPEAPASAPWDKGATYTAGDTCTKDGRIWECLIPHGPERQGTWAPGPATPTI